MTRNTVSLMVMVASFALGIALIRHALIFWGSGELITIALVVLSVSTLRAIFQRRRGRAFWLGFVLFGWGYLALSQGCWTDQPIVEHLPTTWLIDALFDRLNSPPRFWHDDFGESIRKRQKDAERFRLAGNSIVSLLLALIGGVGVSCLFSSRAPNHAEIDPPDGSLLRASELRGLKP
jgi:hypothetical protein